MQHAQDIHFSPLAVDLINQNKMGVKGSPQNSEKIVR